MDSERIFRRELRRVKRVWQTGLVLDGLLQVAGGAVVAVALGILLDRFLAFPSRVCLAIGIALPSAAGVWFLAGLARVAGMRTMRAARRADELLRSPRRTVQSALELVRHMKREGVAVPELERYLAGRIVERGGADLGRLRFRDAFPLPELGRRLKVLLLQLVLAAGLFAVNPEAARVSLTRLFFPLRDTPPYSRHEFAVFPRDPRVLYGGNAEIGVEITGAPLDAPVWCLTRTRGRVARSACFQENGHRFTQRLERMVSPLEFCFATGKARSRWHRVEVLMQPEIASASATVTPPDYTALAPRHLTPGREDFAGYRLSRAELRVVSNRPLLGGLLTIVPKDNPDGLRQVEGERVAVDTVAFRWELREEALLQVLVRDVRGTTNREPLRIQQKLVADRPPEVSLDEPGTFMLATPSVSFDVAVQIADDLGLRKAELVRAVVGYRDRSQRLPVPMGDRRFAFTDTIDLRALGAEPGQILEFYAEAVDGNPDFTGVSASDIVRVQIITEEEYAAMVRARVTLDEFARRFDVTRDSVESVVQALQAIQRAIETGDPAGIEARRKEALETTRRVAALLEKLANDFPVFDLEASLADTLKESLGQLRKQADELEQAKPGDAGFGQSVERMIGALGGHSKALQAARDRAQETAAIGRVMEMVARFKNIVSRQSELVRRLARLNQESGGRDVAGLIHLTRRQNELRVSLPQFAMDLREHAGGLPAEYDDLRKSAEAFADKLRVLDVTGLMGSAVQAGENQDARRTLHWATLALEKLRELISSECGGGFGGMCEGRLQFKVSEELNKTLQQMLEAICQRLGGGGQEGQGGTAGGGIGADINDGYRTGGYSPLNVPALGPARTSFPGPGEGGRGQSGKGGSGGGGHGEAKTTGTETMEPVPGGTPRGESLPSEQVPEKYRDAVKKYFGNGEDKHER